MSKIEKVKICERCGKDFLAESGYVHYCDECKIIVKNENIKKSRLKIRAKKHQDILRNGIEDVDYVIDRWNGLPTTRIPGKWFNENHPDRTLDEYISEFPDAKLTCENTSNKISKSQKEFMNRPEIKQIYSDRIKGDKNPNAKCNTTLEQRQRISPFSKSFKKYDGLSDEEKERIIRDECLQYDRDDRSTNQIKYWIKKGYSEDDAKKLVSNRQRTFTLDKCIEKYGEIEGKRIYKQRQIKWSQKVEEKYKNGEFSKIPKSSNSTIYSKFEKDAIENIITNSNINIDDINCYKNNQLHLKNIIINDKCKNVMFTYDLSYNNKIIEFNGDYWHMNPKKYDENFYNALSKMVAKDKWIKDEIKIENAKQHGYNVLIIWECDYKNNKEEVIQQCIDFLLNKD